MDKPPRKTEKTEGPSGDDAADEVGGFAFDAGFDGGGGGASESPGFGGFRFAEETAPTPSPAAGIFQMASGKNVTPISADAMRRARGIFRDDTAEFRFGNGRVTVGGNGGGGIFQTASGKDVAVSADAMRRARIALGGEVDGAPGGETIHATGLITPGVTASDGFKFQTGSGKTVTPSAAAMRRGERVLGERGSGPEDTARKKARTNADTAETADASPAPPTSTGQSGLFRTGTGRAVAVSDDAVRRARSIRSSSVRMTVCSAITSRPPFPARI